jgi:uncharacterized protein YqgV (UPF0045/DUF77 family)
MPRIRVEFTVEPFTEGVLGPHVAAALDVLRRIGYEPDIGPFGTAVEGEAADLWPAISASSVSAFAAGATGLSISARVARVEPADAPDFLAAIRPIAHALGSRVIGPEDVGPDDLPLVWRGQIVGGLDAVAPRPHDLREGLGRLVTQIETELGGTLAELPRAAKQRAVRLLDERGAFAFRNAVDEVADAMGVSRVTVYNYLNATRSGE